MHKNVCALLSTPLSPIFYGQLRIYVHIFFAKKHQNVIKIEINNDNLTNIQVLCVFISFGSEQVFDYQL